MKWQLAAMENTLAATPKARLATGMVSPLPFPVPPPPAMTARMTPTFAFPPLDDAQGATRPQDLRATRHQPTVLVRRANGLTGSMAGIASFIESAPLPSLPDGMWRFLAGAWFFFAGTTMGVLLAAALIASIGGKHHVARHARGVDAQGTARALVIQRAPMAAERNPGELASNDNNNNIDIDAPAPMAIRRPVVAARRPVSAPRSVGNAGNAVTKDLLNAGL